MIRRTFMKMLAVLPFTRNAAVGSDLATCYTPGDVLTVEHLLAAEKMLREANVPSFPEGYYFVHVHPLQYQELLLDAIGCEEKATYRVRDNAVRIYAHESRRKEMRRRSNYPTAREAYDRAWKLEGPR